MDLETIDFLINIIFVNDHDVSTTGANVSFLWNAEQFKHHNIYFTCGCVPSKRGSTVPILLSQMNNIMNIFNYISINISSKISSKQFKIVSDNFQTFIYRPTKCIIYLYRWPNIVTNRIKNRIYFTLFFSILFPWRLKLTEESTYGT